MSCNVLRIVVNTWSRSMWRPATLCAIRSRASSRLTMSASPDPGPCCMCSASGGAERLGLPLRDAANDPAVGDMGGVRCRPTLPPTTCSTDAIRSSHSTRMRSTASASFLCCAAALDMDPCIISKASSMRHCPAFRLESSDSCRSMEEPAIPKWSCMELRSAEQCRSRSLCFSSVSAKDRCTFEACASTCCCRFSMARSASDTSAMCIVCLLWTSSIPFA
mmetsp:Transcript_37847/g.108811  ORF Transcript_37847/g.108811 Transcript_37847/m.108811 type:complete len:220 (+) Transcript_37847:665-1324(+)